RSADRLCLAIETEAARAGATRRRLRLRYARRRHMARFPPPSSPRSARPTTFATHLRDRPPATSLRSCHSSRQHVSPPRWSPHRIPPRPGRPGKIRLCRAFLLSRSQRERTTCRVVAVPSRLINHLSLSSLPTFPLPAVCHSITRLLRSPLPALCLPPLITSHQSLLTLVPHPSPITPSRHYSNTPAPRCPPRHVTRCALIA